MLTLLKGKDNEDNDNDTGNYCSNFHSGMQW